MECGNFWTEGKEEHIELVEEYYRNIEITHPGFVTSKRMCPCLEWCSWCGWANTSVKYREYRGPRVSNI